MSSFSDVGIALKNEAIKELELQHPKVIKSIRKYSGEKLAHEEGVLFILKSVKWDESEKEISSIVDALESLDGNSYYWIEASHDYHVDNEDGGWDNNPWCLQGKLSMNLYYEKT